MSQFTLWEQITSFGNLYAAYRLAAKSRHSSAAVAAFEFALEENLITLQRQLRQGAYTPGAYTNFYIHDPKRRLISAAPFRDRVVHHALVTLIEPIFERKFIFDSYANRRGKGTHRALDRCTCFMRRYEFVLPLDIAQYFPSIDHHILYSLLAKVIGDYEVLRLCRLIIDSGGGIHSISRGDARGLPIGNLLNRAGAPWKRVLVPPV